MSETGSTYKTAIIVAIIGLAGTLITVTINNWDKIFKPTPDPYVPAKDNSINKNATNASQEVTNTAPPVQAAVDDATKAEAMVSVFLAALKSRDVNALVAMSSIPFYNDHDVQISLADVRDRFEKNFAGKNTNDFPLIKSIKVKTVTQWKNEGLVTADDRILRSLNIADNNYLGVAEFEHDGLVIVFRKQGSDLKVAGIWD